MLVAVGLTVVEGKTANIVASLYHVNVPLLQALADNVELAPAQILEALATAPVGLASTGQPTETVTKAVSHTVVSTLSHKV